MCERQEVDLQQSHCILVSTVLRETLGDSAEVHVIFMHVVFRQPIPGKPQL